MTLFVKRQQILTAINKQIGQKLDNIAKCSGQETACKSDVAKLFNERGLIHYKTVEFEDAINDFTAAIGYDPQLAAAYYNRGTVFYRMSNFKNALPDMEKAHSMEPVNPEFKLGLEQTMKQLTSLSVTPDR